MRLSAEQQHIEEALGVAVRHIRPWKHGVIFTPNWPPEPATGRVPEGRARFGAEPLELYPEDIPRSEASGQHPS